MISLLYVSALLLLSAATADEARDVGGCEWSAVWRSIAPQVTESSVATAPRHRKGYLERIRPNPGERYHLEGPWLVSIVIDAKGNVVDARMIRTASDPPWPRYEEHLLKGARKFKYEPMRLDGKPVASCLTLALRDKLGAK